MREGITINMSVRVNSIDVAKGIAILLVVIGHTLKDGFIRQVVYSFHIPVSFFFSGVTYKYRGNIKNFWLQN